MSRRDFKPPGGFHPLSQRALVAGSMDPSVVGGCRIARRFPFPRTRTSGLARAGPRHQPPRLGFPAWLLHILSCAQSLLTVRALPVLCGSPRARTVRCHDPSEMEWEASLMGHPACRGGVVVSALAAQLLQRTSMAGRGRKSIRRQRREGLAPLQ